RGRPCAPTNGPRAGPDREPRPIARRPPPGGFGRRTTPGRWLRIGSSMDSAILLLQLGFEHEFDSLELTLHFGQSRRSLSPIVHFSLLLQHRTLRGKPAGAEVARAALEGVCPGGNLRPVTGRGRSPHPFESGA